MFIIQRHEDGKYVAPAGSAHSYTAKLQDARIFHTKEEAEREKCGNETIVPVAGAFNANR